MPLAIQFLKAVEALPLLFVEQNFSLFAFTMKLPMITAALVLYASSLAARSAKVKVGQDRYATPAETKFD
jgi:hypothetical protein